ncbi:MAG: sulfite exporter TauE/SafE family protein [Candidatus Hodarchaeota archaeon]
MTIEFPIAGPEIDQQDKRAGSAIIFQLTTIALTVLVIALAYFLFGEKKLIDFPSSAEGLPVLTFFLLGITVGMSQCVWKSLPYLLPLLATTTRDDLSESEFANQKQQDMIIASIAFSLGRLSVYSLYGFSILLLGSLVLVVLMDSSDSQLLISVSYGLGGLVAFLYALRRLIHLYKGSCRDDCLTTKKYDLYEAPFALGAMSSVVPCFPMMFTLWISFWGFLSSGNILIPILVPLSFSIGTIIPIFAITILILSGRDLLSVGIGPKGIWISQMLSIIITLIVAMILLASFWLFFV